MDASQVQFECALEAGELDALSGLVAEVVPVGSQPRPVPFTAPLLLFARLDGSLRRRLFADHPGRVLVQEQLLIECRRAPKAGEPIQLSAEVPAGLDTASLIEISGRLTTSDGETIVVVRVGLRHIAGAAIDHLAGFALERLVKGETTQSVRCGPISDGLIARYVKFAGDDNSLHRTKEAIVPGAFLAALAEPLAAAVSGTHLRRMSIRFIAPIRAGESFDVVMQPRSRTPAQIELRLLYASATRGVAAIADLVLSEGTDIAEAVR
ncbi:hypothetical protein ACVWWG_006331 [Bradyrhizobium sp. LB7.2]|jgi:hypothetical protein|uniref:hypothetical protein n=1 Tax=Bradyrhizobium sp. LB14.3 TaxID=3156328 RepID=UPI0033988ABF